MKLDELHWISSHECEIPRSYRADMRVPVRLFATPHILEQVLDDRSIEQAINATTLPGVVGAVVVMPDVHQGYGFPIGGVAGTLYPQGVVSPGAIGYDINCGVRLLASSLLLDDARDQLGSLADRLAACCPSGVGKAGVLSVGFKDLDHILRDGARWAENRGFAAESDLEATEDQGSLEGALPEAVSERAKVRGRQQLGSLGSGNHFLEVDLVDEIFDPVKASSFGLTPGCIAIQIHCGSRGLGHQVCTDFVQAFQPAAKKYGIVLPDRELVCAPMDSPEGKSYLGAMRAAANFAFVNRQILAHSVRKAFDETLKTSSGHLFQVYDVAHNMGKIEQHSIDGRRTRLCVHRKGATRALGPGALGIPSRMKGIGQPVLVPGSMGTASWVLAGTDQGMLLSMGSSCHGAGRVWSRSRARREVRGQMLRAQLEEKGIIVRAGSLSGLAEEAPAAYKDVDEVVNTVAGAGIARKVARLRPVAVIKG